MKILVRVMAEAQAPLLDKELIHIEDVYEREIVKNIIRLLEFYSPYDRRMAYAPRKEGMTAFQKSSIASRPYADRHLFQEWASEKQSMGRYSIYNRLPYAQYLAKGTGIYGPRGTMITPVNKKAMSFYYSFFRRWIVTRQIRGINPARFQKMVQGAQFRGTVIGARRAQEELEATWRGTLQTKLIKL